MILVTGATGLVGSHLLVKLLQDEVAVRAIFRKEEGIEAVKNIFEHYNQASLFNKIEWIKADIIDIPSLEKAFANISEVYHCAAFISFDPSDKDALMKINVEGTANIVNCCIDFKINKLCYVSSIATLGELSINSQPVTEESTYNPEELHSDYTISKYAAEMEVWRGYQEGLQVVIVNPGIIFGYGFPNHISHAFINSISKGNPFYTKGKMGIVAVEDVVNCMVKLMKSKVSGERFILVAENVCLENVLNLIAETLNSKKPFIFASKNFLSFAWRLDWFLSCVLRKKRTLTKVTAKTLHSKKVFDNEKIKKTLQFSFTNMESYLKELILNR